MIPMMNIIAWGNVVPWAEQRQVEQDLIISRAIVDVFSDQFLCEQLRFRGGTALNKLHFPSPIRYSEDIDLVRTSGGPIKPTIDRLRERLEPWLGPASFDRSAIAPKLKFRVSAEDPASTAPIRLKLEINTSETVAFDLPQTICSASTIRGSTERRPSPRFHGQRFWQQSFARCSNVTRGATYSTSPTHSTYSTASTGTGLLNVLVSTFRGRRHRFQEPRPSNACLPSSTIPDS
jgi:hypothetical protein